MKLDRQTALKLRFLIVVSALLKFSFLLIKYHYGYVLGAPYLVNPDELQYLIRGETGDYTVKIGQHFVYEYINSVATVVSPEASSRFLLLSSINIGLSLLYPIVAFPFLRFIWGSRGGFDRFYLAVSCFYLLCPSSIWLAAANLKDTMVTLMVLGLLSSIATNQMHLSFRSFFQFLLMAGLLFSTRSYLSVAVVGMAIAVSFRMIRTVSWQNLSMYGAIIVVFLLSGVGAYILGFFSGSNMMFDRTAIDQKVLEQELVGGREFKVNHTPFEVLRGTARHLVDPLPNVFDENRVYNVLSVQTVLVFFGLIPFAVGAFKLRGNLMGEIAIGVSLMLLIFYGINETGAGPRTRFPSFDILAAPIALFAVKSGLFPRRFHFAAILFGVVMTLAGLAVTSRGVLGASM